MPPRFSFLVLVSGLIVGNAAAQPVNDNYSAAAVIPSPVGAVVGTTVGATSEPGEDARFGYSVWWRWTAPSNGVFTFVAESAQFRPYLLVAPAATNLLVGLSNSFFLGIFAPNRPATEFPIHAISGMEYRVALFSFQGSRTGDYALRVVASAPPTVSFVRPSAMRTRQIVGEPLEMEAVANDPGGRMVRVDFVLGSRLLGSADSPPFRVTASTAGLAADREDRLFAVAVSETGLFGVAGWDLDDLGSDPSRSIAFRSPPPPNDLFDARVPLSGDRVQLTANNGGAGREAGEPGTGDQTLWWSWTAPESKVYVVLAWSDLVVLPQLSLFTGDALTALSPVDGQLNSGGCGILATAFLTARAGETYALSVGESCADYQSFGGKFSLHILPVEPVPRIVKVRYHRAREWAREPVLALLVVGMREGGWTVESSADLQHWEAAPEDDYPCWWVDGGSNWADTFLAQIKPGDSRRFHRLRRIP